MNSNCEYCRAPERYDLTPATEILTNAVQYVDDPDPASITRRRVRTEEVRTVGHLSKHPLRDEPNWHLPCRNDAGAYKQ